jgi:hypothetical protein
MGRLLLPVFFNPKILESELETLKKLTSIALVTFASLLPSVSVNAQYYDQQPALACQNYIAAGYQSGNLIRAIRNNDGSVTCDTTDVSFMIASWHVSYWASR